MNDLRRTLRALRAPAPPKSLREPTLRRALSAWDVSPRRASWIDRLWTSSRLRLAWGLSMLLLAVLDLLATPGAVPGWSRPGPTLAEARLAFAAPAFSPVAVPPSRRSGS